VRPFNPSTKYTLLVNLIELQPLSKLRSRANLVFLIDAEIALTSLSLEFLGYKRFSEDLNAHGKAFRIRIFFLYYSLIP
jgi:hypothetical protein